MGPPRSGSRRRAPILWVGGALMAAVVLPFLIPGVSTGTLAAWAGLYADLMLITFLVVVLAWPQCAEQRAEATIFRRFLIGAFGILLIQIVLLLTVPEDEGATVDVSLIYSYLAFYLCLLCAAAVQPHRARRGGARPWLRVAVPLGTLLLLFGLFMYTVGVPTLYKWDHGPEGWLPALSLYVVLDLVLVGLFYRFFLATDEAKWRQVYAWLSVAFVMGTAADLVDVAMRVGLIPWLDTGTAWDLVWFAAYPPMIMAAHALGLPDPREGAQEDADAGAPLRTFGSLRWLAYALSLPVLHLSLQQFQVLDPSLTAPREGLVLVYVLSMGGVALAYEWFLRSENRRLEAEREQAREQLQAARRLEGIGRLAAGIAHEFNNRLTVLNGSSELLHGHFDEGDPRRELTATMLETGERAADLVSQLLAFSRRQVSRPRVLDLNGELGRLADLLDRTLGAGITIRRDLAPDLPEVEIDPAHVEQIVLNLATNARDALPDGGTITLATARADGDHVSITVVDAGCGMDDQARTRAFEPFFTTKPVGEGTGLGLATVFGLVEQNGGRVELESAPGVGTTVRVLLRALAPTARPAQRAEVGPSA